MKVLVSACLLGERCRYDGSAKYDAVLVEALCGCEIVPICPEVEGGLSCPRLASEMMLGAGKVVNAEGADVTEAYTRGAQRAHDAAQQESCAFAVLKSKSPSCGSGFIYDGSFSGRLVEADGVTARLLKERGFTVVDERSFFERGRDLLSTPSSGGMQ